MILMTTRFGIYATKKATMALPSKQKKRLGRRAEGVEEMMVQEVEMLPLPLTEEVLQEAELTVVRMDMVVAVSGEFSQASSVYLLHFHGRPLRALQKWHSLVGVEAVGEDTKVTTVMRSMMIMVTAVTKSSFAHTG